MVERTQPHCVDALVGEYTALCAAGAFTFEDLSKMAWAKSASYTVYEFRLFFCCHLCYAGFGHINQKLAPYCSRGSSRKQFSSFAEVRFAGICHCAFYISYAMNIEILYTYIYIHTAFLYDVRYFKKFYMCNSSSLPTCL